MRLALTGALQIGNGACALAERSFIPPRPRSGPGLDPDGDAEVKRARAASIQNDPRFLMIAAEFARERLA